LKISTPYYLIDEKKLLRNLELIQHIREESDAKVLLATKCFSTWCMFDFMRPYLDGTTSSSLYEVRLGWEKFGKETHAYSVAYADDEMPLIKKYSDKIIFNSTSQLKRYCKDVKGKNLGIRINPGISYSHFDLADPARKYSRLGVINKSELMKIIPKIKGCMFHFNCENESLDSFACMLGYIGKRYNSILKQLEWVSLGGGIFFTKEDYPCDGLCDVLDRFSKRFAVQVYLEPGDAVVYNVAELITTILDVVHNKRNVAIVDASTEAHMLDILTYKEYRKFGDEDGDKFYTIAGQSCLAGDIFGSGYYIKHLEVGDLIHIPNAAGYTMVKKNWFNGVRMPSVVVRHLDGTEELIKKFDYNDFLNNLS
jgi:Diaminopimelate decarboxylase